MKNRQIYQKTLFFPPQNIFAPLYPSLEPSQFKTHIRKSKQNNNDDENIILKFYFYRFTPVLAIQTKQWGKSICVIKKRVFSLC